MIRSTADTPVSMATSPQPIAPAESSHVADATQQEMSLPAGVSTVKPPPSDVSPATQLEIPQPTKVEPIATLAAATEEKAASAKTDEPVTPTAATPTRRGSTRKRKQGEN
jgi:hypothetical protein